MSRSQDDLTQASTRIREVLLPAGRLIENAKREIDLQVHELSLLSSFETAHRDLEPQQRTLLRLSPSVQSLLNLHASPLFPQTLSQLFQPWALTARAYQQRVPAFQSFDDATQSLVDLRAKTHILQRAVDRELSMQLILVTESSERNMTYWALALSLAFVASTVFAFLVWAWMEPLTKLRLYLKEDSANRSQPFPSFIGRGLASPPREILELSEILREHVLASAKQKQELVEREAKLQDSDRSLSTLFAAISHLLRHNEKLIEELVRKERLASMSEMAAQLAHEIKNPLNSMSLKLELLREDLRGEDRKILDRVLDEIDRLDALTESHLSQTRGGLRGQMPILLREQGESDVPQLFDELHEFHAAPLAEKKIIFETSSVENFALPAPKSVMKSALVNLLKNSEQSLDEVGDERVKKIRVELQATDAGDWKLRVLDNGCGFSEDFKLSPFQMFRTSKPSGSGLGLVTTQKMLEAYSIRMTLETGPTPFVTCWCLEPDTRLVAAASDLEPKEQNL
ncbi:MAG: HAMP domain-containing sensor histidine kinase [Bdellovibrionota bacterium]